MFFLKIYSLTKFCLPTCLHPNRLLQEPPINDFLSDLSLYRGHLYTVSLVHLELIFRLVENEYNNLKMPDLPELPWANHRKYHPAPEV